MYDIKCQGDITNLIPNISITESFHVQKGKAKLYVISYSDFPQAIRKIKSQETSFFWGGKKNALWHYLTCY